MGALAIVFCFEPTYKGLKRIFDNGFGNIDVRFEPTYKGLKHYSRHYKEGSVKNFV